MSLGTWEALHTSISSIIVPCNLPVSLSQYFHGLPTPTCTAHCNVKTLQMLSEQGKARSWLTEYQVKRDPLRCIVAVPRHCRSLCFHCLWFKKPVFTSLLQVGHRCWRRKYLATRPSDKAFAELYDYFVNKYCIPKMCCRSNMRVGLNLDDNQRVNSLVVTSIIQLWQAKQNGFDKISRTAHLNFPACIGPAIWTTGGDGEFLKCNINSGESMQKKNFTRSKRLSVKHSACILLEIRINAINFNRLIQKYTHPRLNVSKLFLKK